MEQVKVKIKWERVLIAVFCLIIIIGVLIVIGKNIFFNKNKELKDENEVKVEVDDSLDDFNDVMKEEEPKVVLEKVPANFREFEKLEDGEYITDKGYTLVIQDGIASIDSYLIVNKTYAIPKSYQPKNSEYEISSERCNNCLDKEVMDAFKLMQSDATSLGLNIYIASGYRSYTYQERLYNNYTAVSGQVGADTYSARPGHSEHQTGLCFDLNSVDDSFANTDEGRWINDNAYLYGFIIRYPKGKESITGYKYESWHLRYVGKELASKLYQNGEWITMEEYFGISSQY